MGLLKLHPITRYAIENGYIALIDGESLLFICDDCGNEAKKVFEFKEASAINEFRARIVDSKCYVCEVLTRLFTTSTIEGNNEDRGDGNA